MSEYRTPDEDRAQIENENRINAVLDEAVRNGAMLRAAMLLGEPQPVVEKWVDALWDGLRDGLSDERPDFGEHRLVIEDRLKAIVMLLTDRIEEAGTRIVRGAAMPEVPDA